MARLAITTPKSGTATAILRFSPEPRTKIETWHKWETLFDAAASCASPRHPSRPERWRLPDLLALTDVLDAAHARLVDIDVAFVAEKALLPGWIRTVGHAAGINLHALAGQATAVLAAWRSGAPDVMDVLFAPPPSSPPACDIARLGPGEVAVLVEALGARSGWIAEVACNLLLSAQSPQIGQLVAGHIAQMPVAKAPSCDRYCDRHRRQPCRNRPAHA